MSSIRGNGPNIVYFHVDNLGYGELGCYGGGILCGAYTRRIDQFAAEGLQLLNFAPEAQCTPSRTVFAGDNGSEEMLLNRGTAGFFEGSYFTGMEASLRTPCIARWPGKIAGGGERVTRSFISPTGSPRSLGWQACRSRMIG